MDDRVRVQGFYDEQGRCHLIEVVLGHSGVTAADVGDVIGWLIREGVPAVSYGVAAPARGSVPRDVGRVRDPAATEVIPNPLHDSYTREYRSQQ